MTQGLDSGFERRSIISGIGRTGAWRRQERTGLDLTLEASLKAIADAGLDPPDIDGVVTWGTSGPTQPADLGGVQVGLGLRPTITFSGSMLPIVGALLLVGSGLCEHVLVFRTTLEGSAQRGGGRQGLEHILLVPDQQEAMAMMAPLGGVSVPTLSAMLYNRYFFEHGFTREQLAVIPMTQRRAAALNPNAIYRDPLTLEEYLSARMISDPICLFDCDVPIDFSIALVVSRAGHAPNLDHVAVHVNALGLSTANRPAKDQFESVYGNGRETSRMMWSRTDLKPGDVDLAQLYDGFSILAVLGLEATGLVREGEAPDFIAGGHRIALDGELPINTNGGQLSAGRTYMFGGLYESCVQLRGEAGERQVPGSEICLFGPHITPGNEVSLILTAGVD
jgi:acetyl-CoA acetyltransferase